jgi:hypothetical protein
MSTKERDISCQCSDTCQCTGTCTCGKDKATTTTKPHTESKTTGDQPKACGNAYVS